MKRTLLVVLAAGAAFAQATDETPWRALDAGLKDTNPARRISAVLAMSVVEPQPRPVALLEGMITDKDMGVRQAVCATLGDMKSRASVKMLKQALEDKAPEVIFAAARALYAMNDPAGREVLTDILLGERKDASGFMTTTMREARLKLRDPKALLLIGVNQAAGLLGPVGAGLPLAEQLLKDGQASGKTIAALLLATDTSAESKTAIKQALSDKNWTVRAAATRAVALRGLGEDYADLKALLDDRREEVKYAAAAAMIRLKQGTVKQAVVKMVPK